MDFTICLIVATAIHCTLLFFDMFFKSCAHYPYLQFLKNTGFEIGFLRAKWKTTFFNRYLLRMGNGRTKFFNLWFDTGLYVSIILLPFVSGILLYATFQLLMSSKGDSSSEVVMQVNLPGVNIPSSELGYYVAALFVCSLVHEFGHAIAAVKEDVHVVDVGVSVVFIVPIAFVSVSNEKLSTVSQWRVLRFLCAGVWHNIVLALIAGLISWMLPILLSPLYYSGTGVVVSHVSSGSPLLGNRGLIPGNIITQINECSVRDENSWRECLTHAGHVQSGFCVSADTVHELDESGPLVQLDDGQWDCCDPRATANVCFEYLELAEGVLGLRPHMCLPARQIIEKAVGHCHGDDRLCDSGLHCIRPMLSNSTSLMQVVRVSDTDVIYMGHPGDIYNTVTVSSFVPKYSAVSLRLAACLSRFLTYLIVFSSGLAMLNLMPCFFFDGEHILKSLSAAVLCNKMSRSSLSSLCLVVNVLGTVMIFSHVLHSSWTYLFHT